MSIYNLSALDDKEFEALAADLLGEHLGVRIERFKPGKDSGVDGRWFMTPQQEAVIQCKHWIRANYRTLSRELANHEKRKLDRLSPARYVLVTSVELSRHNKRSLHKLLSPHVRCESDIYGREDISDLLLRHPSVVTRHYKLWLTSASVLAQFINNAITSRSRLTGERVEDKARRLIKTADFENALRHLSRRRVVIITGEPGIGKTTLAEQLVLELTTRGFELVFIEGDISEAESVYVEHKKQVFYCDDFLGRNLLEALSLKYDSHIVGFLQRVHHDKYKRFVLTSRTNILNQAKQLTDLFDLEKIHKNEYELRIRDLSRWDKARILYSHMWHSNLRSRMLAELLKDRRYRIVIDHSNFNPRLVSFVTDSEKANARAPGTYWPYVTATLKNPKDIWRHFFANQLDQDCRDIVYLVVVNDGKVVESTLFEAFRRLRAPQ